MSLKNDLLLKALKGETVDRPPVWMMRQAGRYLPEYMVLRRKYDFFTRVETPALAAEITVQPVDIVGVDAAILFSDILVIPQAMGLEVQLVEKMGPYLPETVRDQKAIDKLHVDGAEESLDYVYKAIEETLSLLDDRIPLIGFAGAPFTLLCYMVEGKGSKTFATAKQFCFQHPELAKQLLQKITDVTIKYLERQVAAGVHCVQVFDSWSGLLSEADFNIFSKPYLEQISAALSKITPVILFPKGSWYALESLSQGTASALGVDWCLTPQQAREITKNQITLQGNFDPNHLMKSIPEIQQEVKTMIDAFGKDRYIANLGHGILPNIPVDHAKAFVDAVKSYSI